MAIEKISSAMLSGLIESSQLFPYYVPQNVGDAADQTDAVYSGWTVAQVYAAYDALVAAYPDYVTKETSGYQENSGTYDLVRYKFTPEYGHEKTIQINAGIHGSEKGGVFSTLRLLQIICEEWKTNPQLSYLRNNVRLVVIPIANPWGFANNTLVTSDATGNTTSAGTNANRNYDCNWSLTQGSGSNFDGAEPFSSNEAKWVRDTAFAIGLKNLHCVIDMHDAPTESFGDYWVTWDTFNAEQKTAVMKNVDYLVDKNITGTPNIVRCRDNAYVGVCVDYFNKTLGVPASTIEVVFGSFSYDEAFMYEQVEVRLNALIMLAMADLKKIVFDSDKSYFKLTRWTANSSRILQWQNLDSYQTYATEMSLWDELVTTYPSYVSKSETYVTAADGNQVYTYTLSPKKPKHHVLLIGGRTEPGKDYKRFAKAMYHTAKLLCEYGREDEHSAFVRDNVSVSFVPYIEYASNSPDYINAYGNYNAAGVPGGGTVETNIATIMNSITGLDGVIYSNELVAGAGTAIYDETTDAKFILASQDSADSLGVQDYVDWLIEKGENVTLSATASTELANYVFNNRSLKCLRIDTGIDHTAYAAHKDDFWDGTQIYTMSLDGWLNLAHEVARRVTNIFNGINLICK